MTEEIVRFVWLFGCGRCCFGQDRGVFFMMDAYHGGDFETVCRERCRAEENVRFGCHGRLLWERS